jgi:hypothetical protein
LKAGEWFRRGRLVMVSPVHGDYRRCQAEIPLIVLSKFPRPALAFGCNKQDRVTCKWKRAAGALEASRGGHGSRPSREEESRRSKLVSDG